MQMHDADGVSSVPTRANACHTDIAARPILIAGMQTGRLELDVTIAAGHSL
jgi:hypothetical protein